MNKKHFLLLTDALSSGGAEHQLCYLAILLKKSGYEVHLVKFFDTPDFYDELLRQNGLQSELFCEGEKWFRRPFVIRRLVKQYAPDMVVSFSDGCSMAACLARLFTRFLLVVSERNSTQKLTFRDRCKFLLYRWATHIVPNSYTQANFLHENYPSLCPKLSVITNMVDTDLFVPPIVLPHTRRIVTLARVVPQKNVLAYLDALSLLKQNLVETRFEWYGDRTDAAYYQLVENKIKELSLENYVSFYPATHDVLPLLQSSDAILLPSIFEGFPNVVCEAMSCGLPVICSRVCDNPYIVKENINGFLFDPNSPNDMASKIRSCLNLTVEERAVISKNNRSKMIELCSADTFVGKFVYLLSKTQQIHD